MKDKPLQTKVGNLCNALEKAGLPTIARLLAKAIGDRSRHDHEKWDAPRAKVQEPATEALAYGIHTPPTQHPELPLDQLRTIHDLPPQDLGSKATARSNELEALDAAKAIHTEGKRLLTPDPLRLLNGIVALAADKQIWMNLGKRLGKPELYESVIQPAQVVLLQVAPYDQWLFLLCQASRIYGTSVTTIPVEQVYRGAPQFVENAGEETAMSLSTSSGIIDPLERAGTEAVLKELKIPADSPLAAKFRKKDDWRVINFRDGLLNPTFKAHRIYIFDRAHTATSMRETLALLPKDTRDKYIAIAARNLASAVSFDRFELREVPKFDNWMWRYTRSSPNHVLISLRHQNTKSIAEGIELNFKTPETLHRWFHLAFALTHAGAYLLHSPHIAHAVILAGGASEEFLSGLVRRHLVRPGVHEMLKRAPEVRLHALSKKAREEEAAQYIRSLISGAHPHPLRPQHP